MSEVETILRKMADGFRGEIDDKFAVTVQLTITGPDQPWSIIVKEGREIEVPEGSSDSALFYFTTGLDTLREIADRKMNALTAAAQATASDPAPLGLKFAEGVEFDAETRVRLYTFVQHFFNVSVPEKTLLGEQHSRVIHGGHVVALYYHPGFRSAWFMLKQGEKLNSEGDTNPFPQAFVFIEGSGFARIGEKTIEVSAGESYFIPPNCDHIIWNERDNPLVLLWLAWGEGA
jgi:mannose-6-phosphate isomerase-like protein (cupin superfamily)